jgi:hypothetical protein
MTKAHGSQEVQLGDNNVQVNLFSGEQPQGPVVAGSVPQPPPASQPLAAALSCRARSSTCRLCRDSSCFDLPAVKAAMGRSMSASDQRVCEVQAF